jgi:hypothetical protein
VLRIQDVHPGSEFFHHPGPGLKRFRTLHIRIRIRIEEFKYFLPKNCFYEVGKMITDFHPASRFFSIPDPDSWVSKAPDPGSESATLAARIRILLFTFMRILI